MSKCDRKHRVGDPSSKYGYQPELFEEDIKKSMEKAEALWREFKAWMEDRGVTPEVLRRLFVRLYDEFLNDEEANT